jgi:DNA gyrase/topoisomerase IV subunit A
MEITQRLKEVIKAETNIDVNQNCRLREVVEARAMYCYLLKYLQPSSTLQFIGNTVNRNHSAIIHLLKTYPIIEKQNQELRNTRLKVLSYFESDEIVTEADLLRKQINDLHFEILRLKEELSKPQFSNTTINKLNELMTKYDGTDNKTIITEKLEAFYKMNSNLTRFV